MLETFETIADNVSSMPESSNTNQSQINLDKLRRVIIEAFDEGELRTLCFELHIDYDDLLPGGKSDKVRELVRRVGREKRLGDLVDAVLNARPHVSLHSVYIDTSIEQSPFKGLLVFEEQDADIFFGRETFTADLVIRLSQIHKDNSISQATSFLALVGASGSGKSSIARAGLIPAIRQETDWSVRLITPTEHPLESLATTLTQDSESVTATTTLMDDLQRDQRSLHLFIRRLVEQDRTSSHLLLIVDQFEELFTLCRNEDERQAFIDNLVYAVKPNTAGPIVVVITLRADFYSHCLHYGTLHELLERQQKIVPPMNQENLRAAIEHPATKAGLVLEDGLDDLILRDVGDEPGNLPLLSHVLLETWKRREGNQLTLAGYTDAGGVRGAIAKTAESTYQRLTPDQQILTRNIFLRLTELGEGTQDTRRRVNLDELLVQREITTETQRVLNILADNRLITTSDEGVEVAHEALIREWPTLRHWLDEDREGLRIHRQLTEAATIWAANHKDDSYLYRGARLEAAREWGQSENVQLNQLEQSFLVSSKQSQQNKLAEAEARVRRSRRLTYLLGIALLLMVGAVFLAFSQLKAAQARQLLTQAQIKFMEDDLVLAALLALESNALIETNEATSLIAEISSQNSDEGVETLPDSLTYISCQWIGRNLTQAEWLQYKAPFAWSGRGTIFTAESAAGQLVTLIGIESYHPTCSNLPSPEVSPILTSRGRMIYGVAIFLFFVVVVLLLVGLIKVKKRISRN